MRPVLLFLSSTLLTIGVSFIAAGESTPPSPATAAKTESVQGVITAAPDAKGVLSIQPQGTKAPADVIKVATDEKTAAAIAQDKIKPADLKAGMWMRAELANGVAAKITAGYLWQEDGEKLVFFKGLPAEFFLHPAGFDVDNVTTKFGPLKMMYRLTGNGSYLRWGRKALPKEGMVVYWPATLRARFYDGITRPQPDSEGRLVWPADISEMRVWFLDPVVPAKAPAEKPKGEPQREPS
ncbi:MAG: hypothetical protein NT049_04500 [Planctomycetota bacterium]|nr:hypothetical protein [Planctomycetota bacterium]